jgi:hypothetical protein
MVKAMELYKLDASIDIYLLKIRNLGDIILSKEELLILLLDIKDLLKE